MAEEDVPKPRYKTVSIIVTAALLIVTLVVHIFIQNLRDSAVNAEVARSNAELTLQQYQQSEEQKKIFAKERARLDQQAESNSKRAWQLWFTDDFSNGSDNWSIHGTPGMEYNIVNGELNLRNGEPQIAVLKKEVVGDVKIEFDCFGKFHAIFLGPAD